MPKAKDTADAERAARRRRLEALREDCVRHKRAAVALSQRRRSASGTVDLEKPTLAAWSDEDERDAKPFLERLGEVLADAPDLLERLGIETPSTEWRRSRRIAMEALLARRPWRVVVETSATWLEADGKEARKALYTTSERKVPDVFAAIAELCDELLEVKPSAERRRGAGKVGYLAWMGIATDFEKRNGRKPQGKEMASMLRISPSTFSRGIRQTKEWTKYAASAVRDPKREPKK